MNIVVCIKQVPDVDDIKWTKENNLDRSAMLSKINPYDELALDCALKIKTQYNNVNICALSMGPKQAEETLRYAIAKGADRAILLSDKAFSGSDTLVTAKILARAIKKYIGDFDLIITGQIAPDGDTAQVPIMLAQLLSIPDIVNICEIHKADKNSVLVSQRIDNEINMYEMFAPCLMGIENVKCETNAPKIEDYIRAQNVIVETYDINDLEFDKKEVGILGSPTMVYRAYRPEINKKTVQIKENYAHEILNFIQESKMQ